MGLIINKVSKMRKLTKILFATRANVLLNEKNEPIPIKKPLESFYNLEKDLNTFVKIDNIIKLDSVLKNQFELAFNADFSDVRLHTGAYADEITREHGADAVTIGYDIYFAGGKYRADTQEGINLLAHELQHVIQHQKKERFKYKEDIENAEHEASAVESSMNDMRLHNITSPLLDQSDYPKIGLDEMKNNLSYSWDRASARFDLWGQRDNLDDFTQRRDKPIINFDLDNGDIAKLTQEDFDFMIDEGINRATRWLNHDLKSTMTETDYEHFVLSFIEWYSSNTHDDIFNNDFKKINDFFKNEYINIISEIENGEHGRARKIIINR